MKITLCHIPWVGIERRNNTTAHLRAIVGSLAAAPGVRCELAVVRSDSALRRLLARCQSDVLYLLAHSERGRGVITHGGAVSAQCVHARALRTNGRRPFVVFWNTCHGVETGFVPAWLAAGALTVVGSDSALPVATMATVAEAVFAHWVRDDLTTAVEHANERSNHPASRLQIFSARPGGRVPPLASAGS